MRRSGRAAVLAVVICLPSAALAQLGEVQIGSVATYGTAGPYRPGAGLIVGVAAGRLAYVGARWTYHTGSTEPAPTTGASVEVRNRLQVFGADIGFMFPVGPLELVPGGTLGLVRFSQRVTSAATSQPVSQHAFEFFGAPGASVQARIGALRVIPEIQYGLAGAPELAWPVSRRGLLASLRVVMAFEVSRIRY